MRRFAVILAHVMTSTPLTPHDHSRNSAGFQYVYPVLSRRAGSVSVGINLNPNQACNWRCIYCQVPGLVRSQAPDIPLLTLEVELVQLLAQILRGNLLNDRIADPEQRILKDISLSGDGEPTLSPHLPDVIDLIGRARQQFSLGTSVKTVLITNGSQLGRSSTRLALEKLALLGGEVWFKLDRGSTAGMRAVNDSRRPPALVQRDLARAATLCPTWLQSCFFRLDGAYPPEHEIAAWLELVQPLSPLLKGVLLYTVARPSQQPEAGRLSPAEPLWLKTLAARVRDELGLECRVSP